MNRTTRRTKAPITRLTEWLPNQHQREDRQAGRQQARQGAGA
ncbi:hypothetical protein [Xylella fastidiosa]